MSSPLVDYASEEEEVKRTMFKSSERSRDRGKAIMKECKQFLLDKVKKEADCEKASCSYVRDEQVLSSDTSLLPTLQAMGFSAEDAREAIVACGISRLIISDTKTETKYA
ncbi:hypothetical protein O6H91_11G079400 [Diphasiastrum complanatum]|uniref:Uncharacterized protein n=1 Tax=Diphasiastrum complanatum TaxID=34168 RepID=A0ACC2CB41_DIPCM|nr:hypothetical protein O6H91_11G079400 [Diphasiastrum complanatum]